MRTTQRVLPILVVLCLGITACGVHSQKRGINTARAAIIAASKASEVVNETTTAIYAAKPDEDEESYCRNKILALVYAQTNLVLANAADAVKLWETALLVYLAKQDAGGNTTLEWGEVLSTQAAWFQILEQVLAVLDGVRQTLKLWSVKLPHIVDYAWAMLSGLAGKPDAAFEFDFAGLQESICINYLPGK